MIDFESIICVSANSQGYDHISRLQRLTPLIWQTHRVLVWRIVSNPELMHKTRHPRLSGIYPFNQLSGDHISALLKQKSLPLAAIPVLTAYILKGHL